MGFFIFNGTRSDELGLTVAKKPGYQAAERLQTVYIVPGRNGTLKSATGAFGNAAVSYECWFLGGAEQAHAIKAWLLGSVGYCRLEDSYDPEHYRLACFDGPMDIENVLGRGRFGQLTLAFDAKPQCFLRSGETALAFAATGTTVQNPTPFEALPLIAVTATGTAGTVSVGGRVVQISSGITGTLYLDCQIQNAYTLSAGAPVNQNNKISAAEFPTLPPGQSVVGWTGGVSAVHITPGWWTL